MALADGVGSGVVGPVSDDEWLYRRVNPEKVVWDEGNPRPGSQAFGPVRKGVSVDRASLCGHDPSHTQINPSDYVCSAGAKIVRRVQVERPPGGGGSPRLFGTDVKATPQPGNDAHADVHPQPPFSSPGISGLEKKFKARLAQLFNNWEVGYGP